MGKPEKYSDRLPARLQVCSKDEHCIRSLAEDLWPETGPLAHEVAAQVCLHGLSTALTGISWCLGECESPIEQLLLAGLLIRRRMPVFVRAPLAEKMGWFEFAKAYTWWHEGLVPSGKREKYATLEPQYGVGRYRVDFLLRLHTDSGTQAAVVECDGRDFHERTRRQAGADRERDRVIQVAGYPVFRFTGSQVWKDPLRCADKVYDSCLSLVRRNKRNAAKAFHGEPNAANTANPANT